LLKIVEKNLEISSGFWLFSFDFSNFFENYLSYLKIKEAAETLRMVYFLLQYETFWMVLYVSAKDGIRKVQKCMVFKRVSREKSLEFRGYAIHSHPAIPDRAEPDTPLNRKLVLTTPISHEISFVEPEKEVCGFV